MLYIGTSEKERERAGRFSETPQATLSWRRCLATRLSTGYSVPLTTGVPPAAGSPLVSVPSDGSVGKTTDSGAAYVTSSPFVPRRFSTTLSM